MFNISMRSVSSGAALFSFLRVSLRLQVVHKDSLFVLYQLRLNTFLVLYVSAQQGETVDE